MAALSCLPALAWDNFYLIGPGTPAGWSLDNAVAMSQISDNVWCTVCYLDNVDNQTFRLQPDKDWTQENYYGAALSGQLIGNDSPQSLTRGQDNCCFAVETPGVYYVEADLNANTVKLNRMDAIYVVGSIKDHAWTLDQYAPLRNSDAEPSVYRGTVELADGDFKLAVDPKDGEWNSNFFLFRNPDTPAAFTTDATDDRKWSVAYPDQTTHATSDFMPGRYEISVNTVTKEVRYDYLASTVELAGFVSDTDWRNFVALTPETDRKFYATHQFLNGTYFKPIIDGLEFGYDGWTDYRLPDDQTTYLRKIDSGCSFTLEQPGFRNVYIEPSAGADGTLSIYISAPQGVWYEGICALSYDAARSAYVNTYGYSWLSKGTSTDVMIDGDAMAQLSAPTNGWYEASITFDGVTPRYNLIRHIPSVTGLCSGDITFDPAQTRAESYVTTAYAEAGNVLRATLNGRTSAEHTVTASGYYTITVTLSGDDHLTPVLALDGPVAVNMPLSESDFEGGRKHYFLVGQRTSAWRLQPEWELIPDGTGRYALPARLLYNGYYMVAAVDNYADYIAQTYHGYSAENTSEATFFDPYQYTIDNGQDADAYFDLAPLASTGDNGCTDGKFTGVRYNDIACTSPAVQHGGWDAMKLRLIDIASAGGLRGEDNMQSLPTRIGSIYLDVNSDGSPRLLTLQDINTTPLEIVRLRTFSLVGGDILNPDITYDEHATTPLNHQPGYHGTAWCEAWIQYDSNGHPYIDANGEYIYQTSFTSDWLAAHPSYFRFGDDFHYTSNNITFRYNDQITHADQFGQRSVPVNGTDRKETLVTYFDVPAAGTEGLTEVELMGKNQRTTENLDDIRILPADNRACFVVEDMWMQGMFKIWSGWSGATTNYEYMDNGSSFTRWYRSNAGHGSWRQNKSAYFVADEIMAYSLFEDIDAANFGIGYGLPGTEKVEANGTIKPEYEASPERRFYKRVEIWFNLTSGFGNTAENSSVIVFYNEMDGPRISIGSKDNTHLHYSIEIPRAENTPEEADQLQFGNVTYYKVERIPVYEDGSEGAPVTVDERDGINIPRQDFVLSEVVDPTELSAGRYRYQITTKREKTGDEIRTAKSNIMRVDGSSTQTGIESVGAAAEDAFELAIAQNPVHDTLNLRANAEIGSLQVYTVSGALALSADIPASTASISVSNLPAGLYILHAHDTSIRFIKK